MKRYFFSPLLKGCLFLSLLVLPDQIQAQEGYRISNQGVEVDQALHWQQWTRPRHAVVIDEATDMVRPRFVLKNINAIENMDQFLVLIGDEKARDKLVKDFNRANLTPPLNITDGPASVAGVPIVHLKAKAKDGIEIGDPVIWYYLHGGIREAPNNPEAAAHILDGDPLTYWEPSTAVSKTEYGELTPVDQGPIYYFVSDASGQEQRADETVYNAAPSSRRRIEYHSRSLANWFIDIDLGRLVPVNKIVLRFVDEGMGEPFRQFRILTTPSDSRTADLSLTARTITPNEDERVVEFDLDENDEGIFDQFHRLRIAVTDSKLDKFKAIAEADYFGLPLGEQGGIDYFIVNATGSETKVDKSIYDQVGPERQGRLIYYQRERPRLADIEVWSQGDNISLGLIDGGGSVAMTGNFAANPGFDGRYESTYLQLVWSPDPRYLNRGVLTLDLGASFWIDVFRLVGGISGVDELVTRVSDGSRDSNGNLAWSELHRQTGGTVQKELEKPVQVRFIATQIFSDNPGRAGGYNTGDRIREFQLFGEGHPPEVTLTSPIIELPGTFILDTIEWETDVPDANLVDVQMRTRTGDRLIEQKAFYTKGGESQTEKEYGNLPGSFKGPEVTRLVPSGWSSWSQRYLNSGDKITSPSPRRFVQVQVQLLSKDPAVAAGIRSLKLNFLPPVAHELIAEIWPNEAPLGAAQDFDLYLNPTFVERRTNGDPSPRFDEISIDASPIPETRLVEVSVGTDEALENGTAQSFSEVAWRDGPSGERDYWFEDGDGMRYQALVDAQSGDSLKVVEGAILGAGGGASRLLVRLPRKIDLLPNTVEERVYNRRIVESGDQVPVDEDGRLLNQLTYLGLSETQRGRIIYFEIVGRSADDTPIQSVVDESAFNALDDSLKGEIRYFRQLEGVGGEFSFDKDGEVLTQGSYNGLPSSQRGSILAGGELVRLRFNAEVLLNGTTVDAAIRDSSDPETWQQVDAGDATPMAPGVNLSISVPFSARVLQNIDIAPNPFTPNGDGINDRVQIAFSISNLNTDRVIDVEILDLSGRLIWRQTHMGFGEQNVQWNGLDNSGEVVPPGLYLCKIEVDVDSENASRKIDQRLISVAY